MYFFSDFERCVFSGRCRRGVRRIERVHLQDRLGKSETSSNEYSDALALPPSERNRRRMEKARRS